MKTVKSKTTYHAKDGREFTDQTAALHYEELLDAKEAYEEAKRNFGKLLAETCNTADGEPFRVGLFSDYWYVTHGYFAMPNLLKVDFWGRNWTLEENRQDEATTVVLIGNLADDGSKMDRGRAFRIDELYAKESNAKAALLVAQRSWLEEKLREVQKAER